MKTQKQQNGKNTKTTIQQSKNYLQNELMQYLLDKNTEHLNTIAYIIVKKTMFTYSKTSSQGRYLYTQARHKNTTNQDIQDLKSECIYSILQQILQDGEQDANIIIKNAFRQVNNYLYTLRSIQISTKSYQYSIEELTENGIQLVNIHNGICALVKNDEYIDVDLDTDNEKRQQQQKLIKQILVYLTPLQKQITKMLALGNSQRQIATKLNRAVSTINEHINNIRKIANKIIN